MSSGSPNVIRTRRVRVMERRGDMRVADEPERGALTLQAGGRIARADELVHRVVRAAVPHLGDTRPAGSRR